MGGDEGLLITIPPQRASFPFFGSKLGGMAPVGWISKFGENESEVIFSRFTWYSWQFRPSTAVNDSRGVTAVLIATICSSEDVSTVTITTLGGSAEQAFTLPMDATLNDVVDKVVEIRPGLCNAEVLSDAGIEVERSARLRDYNQLTIHGLRYPEVTAHYNVGDSHA